MFKSNIKRNINYIPDTPNPTKYNIKLDTFSNKCFKIKEPTQVTKKGNMLDRFFG